MLAKAYITMGGAPLNDKSNLEEAKILLEKVMGSGQYSLVQSDTPYQDLWDWQNENNSEMMYSIPERRPCSKFQGNVRVYDPK
ncbi:hypothetical protein ACU8V7_03270 [Zobellia nedashkovskayae]